jgi:hypothetical protein
MSGRRILLPNTWNKYISKNPPQNKFPTPWINFDGGHARLVTCTCINKSYTQGDVAIHYLV